MPRKKNILSLAISGLLILPAGGQTLAQGSRWDCIATPEGGWSCEGEGSRILVEPPAEAPVGVVLPSPEPSPPTAPETAVSEERDTAPGAKEQPGQAGAEMPAASEEAIEPPPTPLPDERPATPEPFLAPEASEVPGKAAGAATDMGSAEEVVTAPEPIPDLEMEQTPVESTSGPQRQEIAPAFQSQRARGARTALLYRDQDVSVCAPAGITHRESPTFASEDRLIRIGADGAEYYPGQRTVRLSGGVEIRQDSQRVLADEVLYNHLTQELDARGSVYYERPGLRVESAGGVMRLDSYEGVLEDIEYRLPERGARGQAESLEVSGRNESRFRGISYTTCPPGSNAWALVAEEIQLHQGEGVGEAHNARLRLGGVPVLYLPYINFPVGDQRKSGLLAPSLGYSDTTGVDLSVPYYFNLAPNFDATLTARLLSKRGPMLGTEFRYLTRDNQGQLRGEILPHDLERDEREGTTRGAFSVMHEGRLADRWSTEVDVGYVSDSDYIDELGNSLAVASQRQLERRADLRYHGEGWSFLGRVQGFQTVDQSILKIDRPYSRLPQALLTLEHPLPSDLPLTAHLRSEYVNFDKDEGVVGHRLDLYPALSVNLERSWGFLRPKVGIRHTLYRLDDQPRWWSADPQRTLPIASLDTGLIFERSFQIGERSLAQTLEPRLYYLYVPDRDQTELPLFDTSERDFTFESLFEENRFNGADRIGDANQLTAALVTRSIQDADGAERLRIGLGQTYYFDDRKVQLDASSSDRFEDRWTRWDRRPPHGLEHRWPRLYERRLDRIETRWAWWDARRSRRLDKWWWPGATRPETDSASALVAAAMAKLSTAWTLRGDVRWDPEENRTESSGAHIEYRGEHDQILNLSYRLRRGQAEHSDFSARLPLGRDTHLVGRWDYSWLHDRTIEAFGGIEYGRGCCWLLRAVARTWVDDLERGDSSIGLFVQLELKGLTSLGSSVDDMLEEGILGYGTDF